MKYGNITILGTSHIAKQSLKEVQEAIETGKPDIVALELDKKRLYSLMHGKKDRIRIYDIKRIGLKGYFFALFGGWAEKKLGNLVGVVPGSEMKQAALLAREHKLRLALIDQDIEITLKKFSKSLSWKERWQFVKDVFNAIFRREKLVTFDLSRVPSKTVIKKMIAEVKKKYPNVYQTLIDDRNHVMARNLRRLAEKYHNQAILAIVGAGHEEEIIGLLKKPLVSYSFTVDA